ncbi:hypothetical protein D3OALGA1CA_2833 [Olavius algarvensis associated proteobacterium Delta 3]|nr:hypothetical protein D3OALGA1CA_2833 [Olavius algarvensis associated proteobacterium Delta 3]CAB5163580.1 hypothetical protein D3OALGB2SA_5592 [Olavius algarvensis associated proteobacterium Delta 3]
MPVKKNIFVADDILIKTGYFILFLLIITLCVAWSLLSTERESLSDMRIGIMVPVGLVLLTMPIAFLIAGYRIRAKEKKYLTVWNILENTLEVSMNDLANNTGLKRETITRALQEINQRGTSFFIYDRTSGLIFDGRLKSQTISISTCPACKHTLGYTIPLVVSKLPRCKYCGTDIDASHLNRLKQEKIQFILESNPFYGPNGPDGRQGKKFSWMVFLILLFVFWPLAIGYALVKSGKVISINTR